MSEALTRDPHRHRRLAVIGSIVLLALTTSCSAGQSDSSGTGVEKVASVPRTGEAGAATPTTAVNVDDQRPLVRMDATAVEETRLYKVWEKCLVREGGDKYKGAGEVVAGKGEEALSEPKGKDAAQEACAAQQPERYADREKRTDPSGFKDDNLQMYRCAKAKGYHLTAPEPDTGEFGLTRIGPQGDWGSKGIVDCRLEAFS